MTDDQNFHTKLSSCKTEITAGSETAFPRDLSEGCMSSSLDLGPCSLMKTTMGGQEGEAVALDRREHGREDQS